MVPVAGTLIDGRTIKLVKLKSPKLPKKSFPNPELGRVKGILPVAVKEKLPVLVKPLKPEL